MPSMRIEMRAWKVTQIPISLSQVCDEMSEFLMEKLFPQFFVTPISISNQNFLHPSIKISKFQLCSTHNKILHIQKTPIY